MSPILSTYPLTFEPLLFEKVWGGRRLGGLGKALPPGTLIGESWELADLGATSRSGAGGGAARSVILNGPFAGRTLHDAVEEWGADLLGGVKPAADGAFPLLIKFLDARENLSVQVHPSPAYAAANPGAHLKTESWYILDAEPGSVIYKGVKPGVTAARLRECCAVPADHPAGAVPHRLAESLIAVPAFVGECHTLPSGTVHALGAGVLVAEVQTPSDTTFRLYDWGRPGRDLHVAEALACVSLGAAPDATRLVPGQAQGRLATTEFFTIDEVRLDAAHPEAGFVHGGCAVVMVVRGRCEAVSAAGAFAPVPLGTGRTALIPAAVAGSTRVRLSPGARDGAALLRIGPV